MNSAREMLQFDFDADAFARRAPQPIPIPAELVNELERIVREHDGPSRYSRYRRSPSDLSPLLQCHPNGKAAYRV